MRELQELEPGVATRITVLDVEGKEMEFRLAVLETKGYDDNKRLEFGFINEEHLLASGVHSGGIVGVGIDLKYDLHPLTDATIVTTDLAEIIKLSKEATKKDQEEREKENNRKHEMAKEINKLPTEMDRLEIGGLVYTIERTKAEYNPSHSGRVRCSIFVHKNANIFWLDNYYRKDGVMMKKRILNDTVQIIGTSTTADPIGVIQLLKEKLDSAKAKISAIKMLP